LVEVTNVGHDRGQLSTMANLAKTEMGVDALDVLADRGYFDSEEILACEPIGVTPYLPKPLTSGAKAGGRFGKQDFVYIPDDDVYRCPAGERLTWRFTSVEQGLNVHKYWTSNCTGCALNRCRSSSMSSRCAAWTCPAWTSAARNNGFRRLP
jgi:hypothetical protein